MSAAPRDGWSALGFDGPAAPGGTSRRRQGEADVTALPGDPRVLQGVVDDFTFLRDTAWSVSQELDAFVAAASAGGFEGATADALRGVVSGRLKTFVYNVARAFSLAGEAVAEYKLALVAAQQAVTRMVSQVQGLTAQDPKSGGLKQQVSDQLAQVRDAEAVMVRALEDASAMVSQPIKVPSLFEKIWKGVEEALNIAAMVLALLSVVVDGPLGVAAFAAAAGSLAMTVADYARGRSNALQLGLSLIGLVMPTTKGIWSLEQVGSGLRGVLAGLGDAGVKTASVLSSPAALTQFLVWGGVRTWRGLSRVPGLVVAGVRAVPGAIGSVPQRLRGLGAVVGEDFGHVQKWYPELGRVLSPFGAYPVVTVGRIAGALFTPMTVEEMAALGFRGAWRAAWARAGSWRYVMRDFGAGWTAKGLQATHAAMDVFHLLESWRSLRLVAPGPVKWPDHVPGPGSGGLGGWGSRYWRRWPPGRPGIRGTRASRVGAAVCSCPMTGRRAAWKPPGRRPSRGCGRRSWPDMRRGRCRRWAGWAAPSRRVNTGRWTGFSRLARGSCWTRWSRTALMAC